MWSSQKDVRTSQGKAHGVIVWKSLVFDSPETNFRLVVRRVWEISRNG